MSKTSYISFVMGVAIGSLATWYCVRKKYELIAQEEIDSVKEVFSRKFVEEEPYTGEKEEEVRAKEKPDIIKKPDIMEYASKINDAKYTSYNTYSKLREEEEKEEKKIKPYVIPPEEFGEKEDEGYVQISLTYYADHILTDDMDQIIEDVDSLIGFDSLTHFGEYEDDSVFVRNDRLKRDFEILRSLRTYSEVIEENPYKAEVE